MKKNTPIFVWYQSRHDFKDILGDHRYAAKTSGEITWCQSLFKTLEALGCEVVQCEDKIELHEWIKSGQPIRYIMDYITIPECSDLLQSVRKSVFCMCYWGRPKESRMAKLGLQLDYRNVLTPFFVNEVNSFLGFNTDLLVAPGETSGQRKFEHLGVLWGKDERFIDEVLVKYLNSKGIRLYAVTEQIINIDNVENLGILNRDDWHSLLRSAKFLLGFGRPAHGPTIIESLYYRTPIITEQKQIPASIRPCKNIYMTDDMKNQEIVELLREIIWKKPNEIEKSVLSLQEYLDRVRSIFKLCNQSLPAR